MYVLTDGGSMFHMCRVVLDPANATLSGSGRNTSSAKCLISD